MTLQIEEYIRKPEVVQVVLVTKQNMGEVAEWCKGVIHKTTPGDTSRPQRYIKVPVLRAAFNRQTMAFAGDRVVKMGKEFKVYRTGPFDQTFQRAEKVISDVKLHSVSLTTEASAFPVAPPRVVGQRSRSSDLILEYLHPDPDAGLYWRMLQMGPGVYEDYSIEFYLNTARVGRDLPTKHNCTMNKCVAQRVVDPLNSKLSIYRFLHRQPRETKYEDVFASTVQDIKTAGAKSLKLMADEVDLSPTQVQFSEPRE